MDNLWYEQRDESTLDDKTHDPKFHKELLALFKVTEAIKAGRTNEHDSFSNGSSSHRRTTWNGVANSDIVSSDGAKSSQAK